MNAAFAACILLLLFDPGGPVLVVGDFWNGLLAFTAGLVGIYTMGTIFHFAKSNKYALQRTAALAPVSLPREALVYLVLGAPLLEEVIFRGYLMPTLGLAASSLLFGVVHMNYRKDFSLWDRASGLAHFSLIGLGLGLVAEYSGLLVSIILHVTVNTAGVLARHLANRIKEQEKTDQNVELLDGI